MRSLKRPLTVMVAAAFAASFAFVSSAGATPPPPIDGTGSVSCDVVASLKFNPPLSAGTAVPTDITFKATLKNCTGTGDGANVKMGKSGSVRSVPSFNCFSLLDTPTSALAGNLNWVARPHTTKLNPSVITFTSGAQDNGPPITIDAGGSSTGGSFSGNVATSHSVVKDSVATITKKCVSAKGLKSISITLGSTFSLASPTT